MVPVTTRALRIRVLPGRLAVCRLDAREAIPGWADGPGFVSITRTGDELSVVCGESRVPAGTRCETGYSAIAVEGPLAPDLVGVLESLAGPLARAGIPILAIGTFDTDYVLVRAPDVERALEVLAKAGHRID